jgi:MFS family permease
VAHEAPKNVLVAELYSREDWERSFAFYEGLTEVGWLIGLVLGFVTSFYGFDPSSTLFLCSGLNLIAFFISLALVTDPMLIFERGLVSIEKSVDFAYRGVFLASRVLDGLSANERLRRENVNAFCGGLILFSLATSILFTPMPIFVSQLTANAGLPSSLVFAVFVLNSGGAITGYFLAGTLYTQRSKKTSVSKITMLRSLLTFLLVTAVLAPVFGVALATAILMMLGFAYALFLVYTLSLSMELVPAGKSGLFNVLIGVGGACGSFAGPVIAQSYGFVPVFVTAGVIFFVAYATFRIFA